MGFNSGFKGLTVHLTKYSGESIQEEMGGVCGTHGGDKCGAYRVLVWKPEGKGPLGRPKRRWEDDIKVDLARCPIS